MPWRCKAAEPPEVRMVALERIALNPRQPRKTFDDAEIAELAASIRHVGVLQPIVVRRQGGGYELVAGERRYRASQLAGLKRIPAVVLRLGEEEAAVASLVENLQRTDLNPIEAAEGLMRLSEEFGWTQEEIAREIGLSQAAVANKLRLLRLDPRVKALAVDARLGERHLRALLRLSDGESQLRVALEAVTEGLTVRQIEERVAVLLGETAATEAPPRGRGRRVAVVRDLRIFLNAFRSAVRTLVAAGVPAELQEEDLGECIEVRVRIPKRRGR